MILAVVYISMITTFISVIILLLFPLLIILWIRFWLEPVKGVCTSNVRLEGKVALVTGGNQGIGLETARDLAARGATVIIACRDHKKSAQAVADVTATTGNKNVQHKYLDLARFSSVREFAEDFNNSYDRLDILVNNAGCGGIEPSYTEDGIDVVMQVNYFGPFLLTNLLLDKVIASKPSRIIILSSVLHYLAKLNVDELHQYYKGLTTLSKHFSYANSKLCGILWTKALAKRLPEGVTVNCLHPGAVKTDIFKRLPLVVRKVVYFFLDMLFKTPKEGAQTTIHLCVSEEVENVRGKYFVDCKEASYSRVADDDELVEQVWEKSVKLTS